MAYLLRFHGAGRAFPELHAGSHPDPPTTEAPRLSVIVAAKDEQETVERCVRSLVAQDVPHLEVVIVDDRSADRTPEVLERLRRELARALTVVTIRELPAGWGGQCHALHQGVRASRGEWLCFTDARTFNPTRARSGPSAPCTRARTRTRGSPSAGACVAAWA